MAWSKVSNQLWIGDKKGKVHVHDATSFEEVHLFEKHRADGKISCCTVSADGTKIATGDSLRNIYVHDAASRADIGHYPHHTAGTVSLAFSADASHLSTIGSDMSFGLVNLTT
jgi:WD40 repeat protein